MVLEVDSKTELESMAEKLETEVIQLTSDVSSLKSKFNNISNYDGINASGAANTLKNNLTNLASDLEAIATSIKLYSTTLNNFDVDDFQATDLQTELNKVPTTSTSPDVSSNTLNTSAPSTSKPSTGNSYTDPGSSAPSTNNNSNNNSSSPGNTNPTILPGGTNATNKPAENDTGITERTVVKIDKKNTNKISRWIKICKEASEQSHRMNIPKIHEIINLKGLSDVKANAKIVCNTNEMSKNIKKVLQDNKKSDTMIIVVGPEGGFSEKELTFLTENDFISVSLGNNVLRAETVPLYILSVINYEFLR